MKHQSTLQTHLLHACLPFLELREENTISLGPVIFWSSARYAEFIDPENYDDFNLYIKSIGNIKAHNGNAKDLMTTVQLQPEIMTCISIDGSIPQNQRDFVLLDSLYLLYFACSFRNLYYMTETPSFNALRKMVPATMDYIKNKNSWIGQFISETQREETLCINIIDPEMCRCLGFALSEAYIIKNDPSNFHKRLIRSIRYLVDRSFQSFVNLFSRKSTLGGTLFDPEDIVFLTSSFEALFDLKEHYPAADFKHKLRTILNLKDSRTLEFFWHWVDDFYRAKRKIIHCGEYPNTLFTLNPNFEVPHIVIGIRLFIYSVYFSLYEHHLINSENRSNIGPPNFKWIHPEEVTLFFWTESHLLHKIAFYMKELDKHPTHVDLKQNILELCNLYIVMQERFYQPKDYPRGLGVTFTPLPKKEFEADASYILAIADKQKNSGFLPNQFIFWLKERSNS